MAHIQVICPHCGSKTFIREHYNEACQVCDRIIINS